MMFSFELFIIFFIFAWIDQELGILPSPLTFLTFLIYLIYHLLIYHIILYIILCILLYFLLKGKQFGTADIPLFAFIPLINPILFFVFVVLSFVCDRAYVSAFVAYLTCLLFGVI